MFAQTAHREFSDRVAPAQHRAADSQYTFTDRGHRAVATAYQAAYDRHCSHLGTAHLLLALTVDETDPIVALMLASAGVTSADVRELVDGVIGCPAGRPRLAHVPQTPNLRNVLRHSQDTALRVGQDDIDTTHLACGVLAVPSTASEILSRCGLDLDRLHEHLHR